MAELLEMMYFDENHNKHFNQNVLKLIANGENDKVMSMIKNTDLSELVHCYGRTLLHYAALSDNRFFIKYLIDKKVELDAIDVEGNTPIMLAIQCNDESLWGPLLLAGADLWKIKNKKGQCALWMMYQNYSDCSYAFQLAMDETKIRCKNRSDIAIALMSAGFQVYDIHIFEDAEMTKEMIKQGCEVNLQDSKNKNSTALHHAAIMNDLDNVKVLLEFGADKNMENNSGRLPIDELIFESTMPEIEIIELLMPDSNDFVYFNKLLIHLSWLVSNLSDEIIHVIFSHLVICEARGLTISYTTLEKICDNEKSRDIYFMCRQEFERMKKKIICGSIDYFKMITYADHKICKFLENDEVVKELSKIKGVNFFKRLVKKRFKHALKINRLRKKAGQFICECIKPLNGYDLVLDNLLDFLSIKDLKLITANID